MPYSLLRYKKTPSYKAGCFCLCVGEELVRLVWDSDRNAVLAASDHGVSSDTR